MSGRFSSINRYARHFFSGTLLSRISGMLRDISMAAIFGDHPSVAAFMVAFRFSHLLRRVLAEGPLQSILIPQYKELHLAGKEKASSFFFQLTAQMLGFLILLTLCVTGVTAFSSHETTSLFTLLFPSLIFISLYGLNTSVMQCEGSFFLSSVAPLFCNLTWIVGIFLYRGKPTSEAMSSLAIVTTCGFAIQWLMTLKPTWKLLKEGWRHFTGSLFSLSTEMKTVGKGALLGIVGVTAVQVGSFFDMIFARFSDPKGPVYLWYAIRLELLPLSMIGLACVYSLTPTLAEAIKSGDEEKAKSLFHFGLKRLLLLLIPATCALCSLGLGAVDLLFGRGEFSSQATLQTTYCLIAYAIGLLPTTLTAYYAAIFYAKGNYKLPTIASLIAVSANIALNALFVFGFKWSAISVAISTSISALLNAYLLYRKLPWKRAEKLSVRTNGFASVAAVSACALFDFIYFRGFFFENLSAHSLKEQLVYFTMQSALFGTSYLSALRLIDKALFIELKRMVFPSKAALAVPQDR